MGMVCTAQLRSLTQTAAARLKDAVDLDSVRDDLARTVHLALEPAHMSLWVSHLD